MKKLFLKLLLILSPVLAILALYVWKDPFKVLYHYDAYYKNKDSTVTYGLNEDYLTTQTFIQNDPRYHYDSYIFGGSRSGFYQVADWEKHIHAYASYHFYSTRETLYGINKKLAFLDRRGDAINNALIVMDDETLKGVTNSSGAFFMKHPALSGESRVRFQLESVKAFFNRHFLYAYCDYLINHKVKMYMRQNRTMTRDYFYYDAKTNEAIHTYMNELITYKREKYYQRRSAMFYTRDSILHYASPVIKDTQRVMLQQMSDILKKHHTVYKIVINPLYDQVKLAPADLAMLRHYFGSENVYDFSGINDITQDKYNYYEAYHYLPSVAARLMDSVYAGPARP